MSPRAAATPARRRARSGEGGREEILDAASRLFTEQGYAGTSTREIALAVGIKQASLYYHFASKEAMLAELMAGTVMPSLETAAVLEAVPGRAAARLHALSRFDVGLLCAGRWNIGALYLLPELRHPRFAGFVADRRRLRDRYGRQVTAMHREGDARVEDVELATDLVFGLVESVISVRAERASGADLTDLVETVPVACLRLLGLPAGRTAAVLRESARMSAAVEPPSRP